MSFGFFHLWRGCFVCTLIVVLLASYSPNPAPKAERTAALSNLVPFDKLFAPPDTVILDPSLLVGQIRFIDADASGNLLITDYSAGLVHLFEPTGHHVSTFDTNVCFPNDTRHTVDGARFADNGTILVNTWEGVTVVFDRAGNCVTARSDPTSTILSFCTWGDSLFTLLSFRGSNQKQMFEVYTMDLVFQRAIEHAPPEFPRLNSISSGYGGRNMDCFQGGVLYKHLGDMDAKPVSGQALRTQARPEYFVKRDRDIPFTRDLNARLQVQRAFPLLTGLYALDEDVRMMLFSWIDESFRLEGDTGQRIEGLSIASNSNQFPPVSTILHKTPSAAAHGYLYFVGDYVTMPDGEFSNSTIVRYRFIPPTDMEPEN
ncbi:MAG: hypothetical protein F4058_05495 [Rhodothermaceae bacterium]|nr:hypothetical protein [Rhodothermaceae bacterium]MYF63785.1 hypothetical protein [Rhodothermaceae bacterium]MYI84776.1 hypothetical protein [Rhodothermaceae bacterium]